jgi:hypothetical protein
LAVDIGVRQGRASDVSFLPNSIANWSYESVTRR